MYLAINNSAVKSVYIGIQTYSTCSISVQICLHPTLNDGEQHIINQFLQAIGDIPYTRADVMLSFQNVNYPVRILEKLQNLRLISHEERMQLSPEFLRAERLREVYSSAGNDVTLTQVDTLRLVLEPYLEYVLEECQQDYEKFFILLYVVCRPYREGLEYFTTLFDFECKRENYTFNNKNELLDCLYALHRIWVLDANLETTFLRTGSTMLNLGAFRNAFIDIAKEKMLNHFAATLTGINEFEKFYIHSRFSMILQNYFPCQRRGVISLMGVFSDHKYPVEDRVKMGNLLEKAKQELGINKPVVDILQGMREDDRSILKQLPEASLRILNFK